MLAISEHDVLRLLPMAEAIRLVREAFLGVAAGTAQNQARRRLVLPSGAMLHSLAGAFGPYFGTKVYSTHPRHGAYFLVLLYDAATGRPLAHIEANHLGQIRTGAASGVATDWLARPDASSVAIVGSGFQARTQLEAIRQVRPVTDVRVWSRNPEKRARFAAECGGRAVEAAREAVTDADIIVTATSAKDPVLESSWVKPGAHINAMGSNHAHRRELPSDLVERADVIAVDAMDQAKIESGDLLLVWPPESWAEKGIVDLTAARRTSPGQLTIFKSNGLGVQDVAVGGYVFERYS